MYPCSYMCIIGVDVWSMSLISFMWKSQDFCLWDLDHIEDTAFDLHATNTFIPSCIYICVVLEFTAPREGWCPTSSQVPVKPNLWSLLSIKETLWPISQACQTKFLVSFERNLDDKRLLQVKFIHTRWYNFKLFLMNQG